MSRIPARLNGIAVAFSEAAKAPMRPCENSGTDHSPKDSTDDLSDLLNSFLERDCEDKILEGKIRQEEEEEEEEDDSNGYWSESEMKHMLQSLVSNIINDGNQEEHVKHKILKETELVYEMIVGDRLPEDFKRQLMSHLRDKGFDAGLCKTRREKFGHHLAGDYEYIDVNVNGTRYILEVNLAGEFEIARPTNSYASLLEVVPPIFVAKPKELKQIVKLMCEAMRESMESRDMHMPPWRRSEYMQSKWFARFRRTINEIPARNASRFNNDSVHAGSKRRVNIEATPRISFHCRDNFASKGVLKVGYLAAAFDGTN